MYAYSVSLSEDAGSRFIGSRKRAEPLRERAERALNEGQEIVFDFSSVQVTQSFIDELVGVLILKHGPDVLNSLVFKSCSDDTRAIIEFVATDRCDQFIKNHTH